MFVASSQSADVEAKFIVLATGLVDHCPPVNGAPADCPSDVIRFCPICDGYEATDRRVGVVGDLHSAGKKALFLRTYTKDVSVFVTSESKRTDDTRRALEGGTLAVFDDQARCGHRRSSSMQRAILPSRRKVAPFMSWTLSILRWDAPSALSLRPL